MIVEKYAKQLKSVVLFEDMDEISITKVLACLNAHICSYKEGEIIYLQGDPFFKIGIVLHGEIKVIKNYVDGTATTINTYNHNHTFGEDIICSGRGIATYSLIANKKATIMYINGYKLIKNDSTNCKYRSQVNLNMLKRIAEYSINIDKKIEYMNILTLKKRVVTFLIDYSNQIENLNFYIDMNREEMARFLNGTRPAISKILMALKKENLIDYYKNSFIIYNKKKLLDYLNN